MKKVLIPLMTLFLFLVFWKWYVSAPQLLTVDYQTLFRVKEKIQQQDPYYYNYYQKLIHDAERCLYHTAGKKDEATMAGVQDYMNFITDDTSTSKNISTLILAGFFSGQEKYSRQAALLLRNFMISDENPVRHNSGRPVTVSESYQLICLLDVYPLLQQTSVWSDDDHEQMITAVQQYLDLALQYGQGVYEDEDCDNYSTWHEALVAVLAYFTHNDAQARQAVQRAKKLIGRQIEPGGRQLYNLNDISAYHCSIFNLQAFYILSSVGERIGEQLWYYTTPDGRGLQKASDYVFHAFLQMSDDQSELQNEEILFSLLLEAQQVYPIRKYEQFFDRLKKEDPGYWPVLLYSG